MLKPKPVSPPHQILFATNNPGKVQEARAILDLPDIKLVTPADLGFILKIEESGSSFETNARLKARTGFQITGLPSLADDSGLEIDALDGRPGVFSARFLDPAADYRWRCEKLLDLLSSVPLELRTASFRCVVALVYLPNGNRRQKPSRTKSSDRPNYSVTTRLFHGVCHGRIATEIRGSRGFGYDPIFVPEGYSLTFAELSPDIKNRISHRAQALRHLRSFLSRILSARLIADEAN